MRAIFLGETVSIPPIHTLQKSQTQNHQYSQYLFELYQTIMKSSFYILLKSPHYPSTYLYPT